MTFSNVTFFQSTFVSLYVHSLVAPQLSMYLSAAAFSWGENHYSALPWFRKLSFAFPILS